MSGGSIEIDLVDDVNGIQKIDMLIDQTKSIEL